MASTKPQGSAADVCAHALAVEKEAILRLGDFAGYLEARGEDEPARLLRNLARSDAEHFQALARRADADDDNAADLPDDHNWLDERAVEAHIHSFIYHLATPYDALKIAILAQERAREYFANVEHETDDPEARELADEMIREKDEQIGLLRDALSKAPRPMVSDEDFERLLLR